MRGVLTAVLALAFAVLALGVALLPLQTPFFTRALSARYSRAADSGLSPERMRAVAEQVRAFVVGGEGSLPREVDGRTGFDEAAVAHLIDVRAVLKGGRVATLVLAAILTVWAAGVLARRETERLAQVLRAACIATVTLPVAGGIAGVVDFDGLFAAFHGLFFKGGTWVFPPESLLIEAFPEPFWITAGVAWAALVGVLAALYWLAAALLQRLSGGRSAEARSVVRATKA